MIALLLLLAPQVGTINTATTALLVLGGDASGVKAKAEALVGELAKELAAGEPSEGFRHASNAALQCRMLSNVS